MLWVGGCFEVHCEGAVSLSDVGGWRRYMRGGDLEAL